MYLLLVSIIGYLFGCIHGSQIVGNYKNINIKKNGMKNAGASNTTVLLGWKYGIIVAIIDISKAIISVLIVSKILSESGFSIDAQMLYVYINGLFVVVGHNFPLTMNFNGGKGTASIVGFMLMINWKFTLMGVGVLLLFALTTDYFVIGTLFMYIAFLVYTAYTFGSGPAFIAFILTILFIYKHRDNYQRIMRKEEIKLSTFFRKEVG